MSDTLSSVKVEGDEQNPADSIPEEGTAERVRVPKKGKKKGGKGKKRRESIESKGEEDDDEEESTSGKKKGKKGKKAAPKKRVSSDVQPHVEAASESNVLASVTVDETPKETVIEIQGSVEKQPDELEEIVVKKESTLIEGDSVEIVQETGDSGEEKKDEKKDSEEEESKDAGSEVEGANVRRRATLSDLRTESVDKGDGEQVTSTIAGSEVQNILFPAVFLNSISYNLTCMVLETD